VGGLSGQKRPGGQREIKEENVPSAAVESEKGGSKEELGKSDEKVKNTSAVSVSRKERLPDIKVKKGSRRSSIEAPWKKLSTGGVLLGEQKDPGL